MADTTIKKVRRFGAEHQIRQARNSKDYSKRIAVAINNGSFGRATHGGERAVKDLITRDH